MKENKYSSSCRCRGSRRSRSISGVGEATQNAKLLEAAVGDLQTITGQKPLVTKARKSISNFKLRQGMAIGCAVTLRRERMYEFLDRLINIAMPRIRDFRGVSPKSFDGRGNYNLGLQGTVDFPRDRLRQNRQGARDDHFHHHHGQNRRRSAAAARRNGNAVPEIGVTWRRSV